jgi:hypothetical protein
MPAPRASSASRRALREALDGTPTKAGELSPRSDDSGGSPPYRLAALDPASNVVSFGRCALATTLGARTQLYLLVLMSIDIGAK